MSASRRTAIEILALKEMFRIKRRYGNENEITDSYKASTVLRDYIYALTDKASRQFSVGRHEA
jgi:glycerol-3-phosphate dehydrogenase